jgi:hypothetical protein
LHEHLDGEWFLLLILPVGARMIFCLRAALSP